MLAENWATFQCSSCAQHDGGDREIFIGQVDSIDQSREVHPLLFSCGVYIMGNEPLRELSSKGRIYQAALALVRSDLVAALRNRDVSNSLAVWDRCVDLVPQATPLAS